MLRPQLCLVAVGEQEAGHGVVHSLGVTASVESEERLDLCHRERGLEAGQEGGESGRG